MLSFFIAKEEERAARERKEGKRRRSETENGWKIWEMYRKQIEK